MAKDSMIFRVVKDKEHPYAMTYKGLIRDGRLGWDTRGLLIFLLSMPDDWEVRMSHLKQSGPAKQTALRRMIREAVKYGYMYRQRYNAGGGKFGWVTLVFESPALNPHFNTENSPCTENLPMVAPPSAGFPSMDDPSMGNPSAVEPSMENLHIYRLLNERSTEWTNNGMEGGMKRQKIDDDDGSCSERSGYSLQKENSRIVGTRVASLAAAWCSAMIVEWLPQWNGGERFAEECSDEQVHALATWLWSARHYGFADVRERYTDMQFPMACVQFIQNNGDPFGGINNPIGKIIEQVRRGNEAPLQEWDVTDLVEAVCAWASPEQILFGTE